MKRIVVILNKSWEADPAIGVLLSANGVPPDLGDIRVVNHPFFMRDRHGPDPVAKPRIEIENAVAGRLVEVWCLEDVMDPAKSGSSTAEKVRVLPRILSYRSDAPEMVVAAGTAAAPANLQQNGSVVVGRHAFVHDPSLAQGSEEHWTPPKPDTVLSWPDSALVTGIVKAAGAMRAEIESRMLRPPIAPAEPPILVVGETCVDLVNVNITDYGDYAQADPELVRAFERATVGKAFVVGCVETTLGVIGEIAACPFVFVAGISDGVGMFDYQVAPRAYAQNTVAAHNIGVVLGWMLRP